ncbi:MAG: hypothetical protein J7484_05200 [Microbacterium sp.]|nr:hypothetical protein [Microbacterium sp.]
MDDDRQAEQPFTGFIVIQVEAAPQGMMRYTLDPEGEHRTWRSVLLAHDDAVMGAASSPEQTADLLVRGSIECIRQEIPSLQVGGLMMWPEPGPHNNAQIVASGEAVFVESEWEAVRRDAEEHDR